MVMPSRTGNIVTCQWPLRSTCWLKSTTAEVQPSCRELGLNTLEYHRVLSTTIILAMVRPDQRKSCTKNINMGDMPWYQFFCRKNKIRKHIDIAMFHVFPHYRSTTDRLIDANVAVKFWKSIVYNSEPKGPMLCQQRCGPVGATKLLHICHLILLNKI